MAIPATTPSPTPHKKSFLVRHFVWTGLLVLIVLLVGYLVGKNWYAQRQADQFQASLDSFYAIPSPLPAAQPGQIIREQPLGTSVQNGSGYRMLYYTQLANGDLAVSSGMVFMPSGPAPAGGRKIVAWAHGTVGLGDSCAPSRQQNPTAAIQTWIGDMLARGYIVTATDYTGLGTAGEPYYLVGDSEARDVLNSVRAAQNFPAASASNQFAVFGHSQGGHAALFTTQEASSYAPELHLVATTAAAPAAELPALLEQQYQQGVSWAIGPIVSVSWPNYYSGLQNSQVVSSAGMRNYQRLAYKCVVDEAANILLRSAVKDSYYQIDPTQNISWYNAATSQIPQAPPKAVPTLIVQGLSDTVVLPDTTALLVQSFCAAGANISTMWLGQTNHLPTALIAGPTVVQWLQARFEGQPAYSTCNQPLPVTPATAPQPPSV